MVDALLGRVATRFLIVTFLPSFLLLVFIGSLLAAGAPGGSPLLSALWTTVEGLTGADFLLLGTTGFVLSVPLHSLQTPLIQMLEGYWLALPFGREISAAATLRYAKVWNRLREAEFADYADPIVAARMKSNARAQLQWLPERDEQLLPTSLGNTLRAGESRAASRYGFEVAVLIPRLIPVLRPDVRALLNDRRDQLDAAARLSVTALVACAASLALLLPTGDWLFVPLLAFAFAWASYRAAVAAAKGFCTDLAAAVDLHHREVWRAMELQAPGNARDERDAAQRLSAFLDGRRPSDEALTAIVWRDPPAAANAP